MVESTLERVNFTRHRHDGGMSDVDFSALRRWPDVEAPNLYAVDATDRLILDEAAQSIRTHPHDVVIIDDAYGALTLGAIALGAIAPRVHQDSIVAQRALAANARGAQYTAAPFDGLGPARVVLWQLPRALGRVDQIARALAATVRPEVVIAGGRIKHMSLGINEVLREHFAHLDVTHARQKSRVLIAREPQPAPEPPAEDIREHEGVRFLAAPGVFNAGRLDIGTRALLAVLDDAVPTARTAVDLGCGSGILAATLGVRRPGVEVIATDVSAAAVASARRTAELNGVPMTVVQDDAAASLPNACADLVLLNPPFHDGGTVHTGIASKLFVAAARLLRPGGELWTVYNSHLGYRGELQRVVGPTRQISRTPKFTVAASTRRP